mgnify:CR=1 FL=1
MVNLFCPITGLLVSTQDEWRDQKLGDHFTANFYIIGNSILYSGPSGIADLKSTQASLRLNQEVAREAAGGDGPYVQIEDYAGIRKATVEARKHFMEQMKSRQRLKALIFCNLSPMMEFLVKVGQRFNTSHKTVRVARDYKEAVGMAREICQAQNLETGPFVFGRQTALLDESASLRPSQLVSDPQWDVVTDTYTNETHVIDRAIAYSVVSGFLHEAEVPMIDKTRPRLRDRLADHENLDYIVVDVSALKGGGPKVRRKYMQSLKEWHNRFPLRMYIFLGVNAYMKTVARLANITMPFKIKTARDMDHAFALIREDKRSQKHRTPPRKSEDPMKKYQEQLLALIGGIDWEQPGFDGSLDMEDESHPFYEVFQAVKLIKDEMDDLFKTRQQMQEQLAQSEKKYRELFEKGSDFLCTHDLDGTLLDTNLAFKKGYGWDGDLPPGLNLRDLIPERYRPGFDDYLERIKRQGRDKGTMAVTTATGREFVLEYHNVLVKNENGEPLFVQGSARDITERINAEREKKKLQEQLKHKHKMEAIATLTGGIAHDYNNLLSIIMGNLALAEDSVAPGSDLADFLKEVEKASLKIRDLTHELMALARGGAPVKEAESLAELLRDSTAAISAQGGTAITQSIPDDLWSVPHDPYKMGSVFRNVITNAMEAMPDGGDITIEAENLRIEEDHTDPGLPLKPGGYVHICIKDQGMGILKEHLDKIYDPYFSTKPMGVQKGMGLGLATAYAIVQKHGGHMAVESTPGVGTTVHIYLPAKPAQREIQPPEDAKRVPRSPIPGEPWSTPKVLVMDDEEMLRNLAQRMLTRLGYEAEAVEDGKAAIETYKARMDSGRPFNAVILDLTVKGRMGGEQAIQELVKIDPEVRAIVSSGYSNDPVMSDFEQYGFKAAMPKPYKMEGLKETLKQVLA